MYMLSERSPWGHPMYLEIVIECCTTCKLIVTIVFIVFIYSKLEM